MSDQETFVTPKFAQPYWAKHAYEVLVETAGRYNAVITYSELAEEVKVNHVRNEPPLASLVVRKDDGQVGAGYDEALRVAGEAPITDPLERENSAAAARLECYRHWGADVPADAVPTLTAKARVVRASTPRATAATEARRGAVCPTCFMEMPVSGPCPNCD